MAELPALVKDLALILIVAGGVTLLFKRLRQPLVLGYIVAGFLVSPHMPYTMSVIDKADVQMWADIGVIFLLFSLGLDFSFKKILKMGMAPVIAAITIILCMMFAGTVVGHLFGWARMDCVFLGGMLAMSSTTIIYKAFDDLGLRQQKFAGLVMSVLILEDIMAIVMMVMLSAFATGANPDGEQMVASVVKIGFFLTVWLVVGIFFIPMFLRKTRLLMNDETMTIVAFGLCCAMACISTLVGFSSAFGAFIMGSILAETIEAEDYPTGRACEEPLRCHLLRIGGHAGRPTYPCRLCRAHRHPRADHPRGPECAGLDGISPERPDTAQLHALRLLHGSDR